MSNLLKINIQITHIGIVILVVALLSVFCYAAHFSLIIPVLLLFLGIHLACFKKANAKLFLQMGLLLTILIFTTYAVLQYTKVSSFYIPVAAIGMLTVLLYNDLQLAFLMSLVSSILVGLMVEADLNLMLIYFLGSLTGVYSTKGARTRGQLMSAGFFVGLVQVLSVALLNKEMMLTLPKEFFVADVQVLFLNGLIAALAVIAASGIFEWLFGVLTNFSLFELSDFNQPLLKRMILEAPGTYHHSLVVSNLAEAAADAIGANALLTRVGAYYHDIGKLGKPEYFTENQLAAGNKHDCLEPNVSRLVILNHVKEGMELAKAHKLNQKIIDFIPQHHGTGIIHYFYQRALEEAGGGESVNEENFRYPGPKPQSKETAVVLLADSVEGATRAIDDPTPTKIDDVVRKIINNKFIDGQLDDCNLTLKEVETISSTFTRVLSAMYHTRIKYPEKKNGQDNLNRKSPENGSAKTHPAHSNRKKNPPG